MIYNQSRRDKEADYAVVIRLLSSQPLKRSDLAAQASEGRLRHVTQSSCLIVSLEKKGIVLRQWRWIIPLIFYGAPETIRTSDKRFRKAKKKEEPTV
jgi:hypothetical protein